MKMGRLKDWSTEKISQRILYVLVGLTVLIFALFYTIGYNLPFLDDPAFNAPLFTDVVIALMWLMFGLALVLAVWSFMKSYRSMAKVESRINGIPAAKINYCVWGITLILLIITFLASPTSPMMVNGKLFQEWFSLKLSGMFVYTSIVLLLIAVGAVIFGATRYIRKNPHHNAHQA